MPAMMMSQNRFGFAVGCVVLMLEWKEQIKVLDPVDITISSVYRYNVRLEQ
jgi:hypothetical protein